jgi:hypothetical protein
MFANKNKQPIKPPVAISHPSQLARFSTEVRRAIKQLSEKSVDVGLTTPIKNAERPNDPWTPFITLSNSTGKVRFLPGTINGVIPSNWNNELSFSVSDQKKYIILNFTAVNGKLNGASLSVSSSEPDPNNVEENKVATSGQFLLGVISGARAYMLIRNNLLAYGNMVYTKGKTVSNAGGEPFDRYYQWVAVEAIAQT